MIRAIRSNTSRGIHENMALTKVPKRSVFVSTLLPICWPGIHILKIQKTDTSSIHLYEEFLREAVEIKSIKNIAINSNDLSHFMRNQRQIPWNFDTQERI